MTNVLDEQSPKKKRDVIFLRNISTNVNIYTRTSTHPINTYTYVMTPTRKRDVIFLRNISTNVNIYTRTTTHSYEHIRIRHVPISTSERLSQLNFEIHKVGHQECLAVDGDVASH
jgi:hypothetical protein